MRVPLTRAQRAIENVTTRANVDACVEKSIADAASPTIPLLARQVGGVLIGGVGAESEAHHDDEHVWHHEQEEAECHRAGEDPAACAHVVLDATEGNVDDGDIGAAAFEFVAGGVNQRALTESIERLTRECLPSAGAASTTSVGGSSDWRAAHPPIVDRWRW